MAEENKPETDVVEEGKGALAAVKKFFVSLSEKTGVAWWVFPIAALVILALIV